MAERELKAVITTEDRTKPGLDSAAGGFDKFSSAAKKVGGVLAGVFVADKILDFGKDVFNAFSESEAAMAKVGQTVSNTMDAMSTDTLNAFQKMADASGVLEGDMFTYLSQEMEKAGAAAAQMGFDDEEAATAMANLFQRTQDLTKSQELLALSQDLARAKGIGLLEAQNLVGQVLSGNGKVLKQYGIEINEDATAMENLGMLHDKVRGQASAFADTTAGKMEILNVTIGNMKETFGAALAEGLQPFLDILMKWVQDPATMQMITQIAKGVGQTLLFAFKAITVTIQFLYETFTKMFEIAFAVSDFFSKTFTKVVDGLKTAFDNLVGPIMRTYDAISKVISAAKSAGGAVANAVLPGRAIGGGVQANTPYLVGEKGPELFIPNSYGRIQANGAMGGPNINITLTGNTFMGREDIAEEIGNDIIRVLKSNMKL